VVVILSASKRQRETIDLAITKQFCPRNFDAFSYQPLVGGSGGILTILDSSVFSGVCVFQNSFALSVDFKSTKDDPAWTLTNVYAPCGDAQQLVFLSWFHNIQVADDTDWLIVGDSNLIRFPSTEISQVETLMRCFFSMKPLAIWG
jgi:hypothetical protein